MIQRELHQDPSAHRPPDEVGGRDPERLQRCGEVVAEVAQAAGRVDGQVLARAEAAQVDRDDAQFARQIPHRLLPEEGGGDVAVDEHDGALGRRRRVVADALEEMVEADQLALLAQLQSDRAADVLDRMEPDDAADLIAALPAARGEELLELMEPEEAEDVRRLLEYDGDTAGGLMSPSPIVLSGESSIAEALALIRRAEIPPAMASAVYVTHPPYETPTGEYLGMAHFQRMLRFPPHERLSALLDTEIEAIPVQASAAEVARRLASYDMVALPVVDDQHHLVGVVTIDDVLDHLLPEDWRHADDETSGTTRRGRR